MTINEIEAFQRATKIASERGWEWQAPFWINLSNGEWEVQAECERVVRLSEASGELVDGSPAIDAATAFSLAKEYAASQSLSWRPGFSLQRGRDGWVVGACQSQLGGQVSIHIDDRGVVVHTWVNPK